MSTKVYMLNNGPLPSVLQPRADTCSMPFERLSLQKFVIWPGRTTSSKTQILAFLAYLFTWVQFRVLRNFCQCKIILLLALEEVIWLVTYPFLKGIHHHQTDFAI